MSPLIRLRGESYLVLLLLVYAIPFALAQRNAPSQRVVSQRTLTFAERVTYQRAIEEVYWRHRIWPKERPDSKPSFDAVMSQAQLQKKVADYMGESQMLEDYWQRPITPKQLQAEMDRMAQHTKQPQVLREIFQSLGDDASVVAECLARPLLAHRLLTELNDVDHVKTTTVAWRKEPMAKQTADYTLPVITSPAAGCTDDTWTPSSLTNAPSPREFHTGVWTGSEMIIWGGFDGFSYFNTGGRYNPTTDSWTATNTTNAPAGRWNHVAVWDDLDNVMTVWGGAEAGNYFNTGGRYCAQSGSPTPTPTATATATGTPAPNTRPTPTPRPRPTPAPRP